MVGDLPKWPFQSLPKADTAEGLPSSPQIRIPKRPEKIIRQIYSKSIK